MELTCQITQMSFVGVAEPICAICGISDICVRCWNKRDAWSLYRDDRDSSTPRFALRSE